MNKLEEIKAMVAKATAPDTQSPIVFDDWGDSRGQDISEEVALLLAVAEAAVEVLQKFREIDADATSVDDCRKRLECSRGWAVALLKQKLAIAPLMEVKE